MSASEGRGGHSRYQEADALAAVSRALREGGPLPPRDKDKVPAAPAASAPAAAVASAPPPASVVAVAADPVERERKKKRRSSDKRRAADQPAEQAAAAAENDDMDVAEGGEDSMPLQGLKHAAAALQRMAEQAEAGGSQQVAALQHQLTALAASAAQLCDALLAAGWADLPAALQLLQAQVQQLLPAPPGSSGGNRDAVAPLAPTSLQLAALSLQAGAAAAAVAHRLAGRAGPANQQQHAASGSSGGMAAQLHGQPQQQQQRFQQSFMSTFADCYASEVEALQEAEPPIPAAVLLQCVRMAADSYALFPRHHRQLTLDVAAAAAQQAAAAGAQ